MEKMQKAKEAYEKTDEPYQDGDKVVFQEFSDEENDGFFQGEGDNEVEEGENTGFTSNVIKAPEFDLGKYEEIAAEILAKARREAESIRNDALVEAAEVRNAEALKGREEGYEEGYNQGIEAREKEMEELRASVEEEKASLQAEYNKQVAEIEPHLVNVIADVFEQVFLIQFADKKEIVLNIVKNAVEKIEDSKEFTIKVPVENLQFLIEHKAELQEKLGEYVKIEIISDNTLRDNQCIIDTDSGVFDCSLDIQLDNLVRDLKSLSITEFQNNR